MTHSGKGTVAGKVTQTPQPHFDYCLHLCLKQTASNSAMWLPQMKSLSLKFEQCVTFDGWPRFLVFHHGHAFWCSVTATLSGVLSRPRFLVFRHGHAFWCSVMATLSGVPSRSRFLVFHHGHGHAFWCSVIATLTGVPSRPH